MKTKTVKKCIDCKACRYLYVKFRYDYSRRKKLFCTEREEIVKSGGTCGKWQTKKNQADLSSQRFDEAVEDIKFILSVLKDN